jgi:hypothetical protein
MRMSLSLVVWPVLGLLCISACTQSTPDTGAANAKIAATPVPTPNTAATNGTIAAGPVPAPNTAAENTTPVTTPVLPQKARSCVTKGQPGIDRSGTIPYHGFTWTITVSNDGGWCSHVRGPEWLSRPIVVVAVGANMPQGVGTTALQDRDDVFIVVASPQHGEIAQTFDKSHMRTTIAYRANPGYIGADQFMLKHPRNGITLPYVVNVIP